MDKRTFTVTMEIEAYSEEQVYGMMDRLLNDRRCLSFDIEDENERKYLERCRYEADWNGKGEHFIFEGRWTDDDDWGLDMAVPVKNDMIHYTALTKIRELMRQDVEFFFGDR